MMFVLYCIEMLLGNRLFLGNRRAKMDTQKAWDATSLEHKPTAVTVGCHGPHSTGISHASIEAYRFAAYRSRVAFMACHPHQHQNYNHQLCCVFSVLRRILVTSLTLGTYDTEKKPAK
jgi:hypothetical protein